jgi:Dolichyl-phosphate-mannose-protein mannosyltransferase
MRSSSPSDNARRFLQLLLIAALVIVGRAPFLLHGDRFFDSDEAVEGLMASHVLQGEHPAFLWGQNYKGVPEVYLAAAVFAITGPSVVALKSVTLACFALFVCLQYVLVERLFSRAIAWMATAFLILGPPSLVLWSLSGNAEVVMTLLAGTVICLGIDVWRRTGSRTAFMTACAAAGFGLWVHQYIIYYWIALGLAILHSLPQRRKILGYVVAAREMPAWLRMLTALIAAVAVAYVALGVAAFLTGGFDAAPLGVHIGVHHPQKLWNIAAGLLIVVVVARIFALSGRPNSPVSSLVYAAVLAFAVGYGPALAAYATGGGSPPIARTDLAGISAAVSPFVRQILPIVIGLRSPATGWLGVPSWLGLSLVFAIVASFVALREQPFTPLFHFLLVMTPLVFLLSGAFVDAQSYRYLMPVSGALAVVLALGVWRTFRWSRVAGTMSLAMILTLFGLEQRAWYLELEPDAQSAAIINCLDRNGVRTAFGDYWLSYKLTFLTNERIVVAPENGVDRYSPYTAQVRAQTSPPRIPAIMATSCTQDTSLLR